jgi:hypothetical protein
MDYKSLYNTFSMFIWGLIMAKTKAGYNAALSKDHTNVKNSWKNTVTIIILIAVATFVQIRLENPNAPVLATADVAKVQGRNLASWEGHE